MADKDPAREAARELSATFLLTKFQTGQVERVLFRHFAEALEDGKRLKTLIAAAQRYLDATGCNHDGVMSGERPDIAIVALRAAIDKAREGGDGG